MKSKIKSAFMIALAAALLILSAGCKQYKVEVTVLDDGSGTRNIKLTAPTIGQDDMELSLEEFRTLFSLDEKRGWKMRREVKENDAGEKENMYIFTLDQKANRITAWQAMSGDLDVRGTLAEGPLASVLFHNEIVVERADGDIITYRETLTWNNLKETVVEMNAAFIADRLAEEYPFISTEDLHSIKSYVAGVISIAWLAEEVAADQISDEMYTKAAADYIIYLIKV